MAKADKVAEAESVDKVAEAAPPSMPVHVTNPAAEADVEETAATVPAEAEALGAFPSTSRSLPVATTKEANSQPAISPTTSLMEPAPKPAETADRAEPRRQPQEPPAFEVKAEPSNSGPTDSLS